MAIFVALKTTQTEVCCRFVLGYALGSLMKDDLTLIQLNLLEFIWLTVTTMPSAKMIKGVFCCHKTGHQSSRGWANEAT